MNSDEMPEELAKQIPHDVRLYVRNFWRHPNDPSRTYDFYDDEGENFLYYLADDAGPLNPENWGDIVVLLFARGCLKTTTCTMIANWAVDCYPNIEGLVSAPRRKQIQEVMGRFTRAAEDSGLDERRTIDQKEHQQFRQTYTDEQGNQRNAYSEVKARSAWGGSDDAGDATRGVHAHFGIVDEFQDVDEDMFGAFKHVVDRSVPSVDYFPTIFVIGTPKMSNSFFNRLWDISNQREWNDDEKRWESSQEATEYLPSELKRERAELQDKIDKLQDWVAENGEDDDMLAAIEEFKDRRDEIQGFKVTGWHIDKYAVPLHDKASIAFDKATLSEKQFKNEVEARFYTPENDLLSEAHVKEAFIDGGWLNHPADPERQVVMGVDWGGGDAEGASSTVVTVGEIMGEGEEAQMEVIRQEYFDHGMTPADEVQKIERYLREFEVDTLVVDEGHGAAKRSGLQTASMTESDEGYDNVFGCQYGNVSNKEQIKWNRNGKSKRYFTVNRTFMIENMVEDFKKGRITIRSDDLDFSGRNSNGTRTIRELTAPYTDKVSSVDGRNKVRVQADTKDDAFHSLVFAWIAWKHAGSRRTLKKIGSHNRTGYDEDEWL
ncbi:terminase large subunit [Haloarcula tailed virus 2]|uniref:Terminase large subunit n=1 Tax=Haloarcula tailed virus 2 TaxID=2877989 RepID=A0AAE9BZG4_9CAUD|nr:terminase large subunit [Haloarcula tailed virus 2]UBF23156.1 terminase large subunit [Haloarcula tailed virus 2]